MIGKGKFCFIKFVEKQIAQNDLWLCFDQRHYQ